MDIPAFVGLLGRLEMSLEGSTKRGVTAAAKFIQTEAKAAIGTYNYGWPSLKAKTILRKTTGDSPLLETGELRESIEYMVEQNRGAGGRFASGWTAEVGSNSPKAVWHELGTATIPPRSFLAETAKRNEAKIREMLVESAIAGLKL